MPVLESGLDPGQTGLRDAKTKKASRKFWLDRGRALHPSRNGEIFRSQELRIEEFRLVAGTRVGKDRHNRVTRPQILCEPYRARNIDAR